MCVTKTSLDERIRDVGIPDTFTVPNAAVTPRLCDASKVGICVNNVLCCGVDDVDGVNAVILLVLN